MTAITAKRPVDNAEHEDIGWGFLARWILATLLGLFAGSGRVRRGRRDDRGRHRRPPRVLLRRRARSGLRGVLRRDPVTGPAPLPSPGCCLDRSNARGVRGQRGHHLRLDERERTRHTAYHQARPWSRPGGFPGLAQWSVLRGKLDKAKLWIAISAVAWAA